MDDTLFGSDKPTEPILPYDGTSGWSGSETSRARAARNDSDGTTLTMQAMCLRELEKSGRRGLTTPEFENIVLESRYVHHGGSSNTTSVLHQAGKICRLTEVRKGNKVYILPAYVDGRKTEPYKPRVPKYIIGVLRALHPLETVAGKDQCGECFQDYPCRTVEQLDFWLRKDDDE